MGALARLVGDAGLPPATPISIAARFPDGSFDAAVSGQWPGGRAVSVDDPFYVASLAKQVTGAAAALLVQHGQLDPDAPISNYLDGLPHWASAITSRQLATHTSGLPAAGEVEGRVAGDWTYAAIHTELAKLAELGMPPGTAFSYSNVGYVLLAKLIEPIAGVTFDTFVSTRLLQPIGITGMEFAGPAVADFEQSVLLGSRRPLSVGDGGLWSTPSAFVQWLDVQNRDGLGIASIVESPGHLLDGGETTYGWGIGLRRFHGHALFVHGGEWTGATAKAVRCPALGISIAAAAAGLSIAVLGELVEAVLVALATSD